MTVVANATKFHGAIAGRVRRAWRRIDRKRARAAARREIREALAGEGF